VIDEMKFGGRGVGADGFEPLQVALTTSTIANAKSLALTMFRFSSGVGDANPIG
jgi:hypothetical protein